MAYGSPRRRRDDEPGIHEMAEEAAREAGLSVSEFLERARREHEEEQELRRAASRRRLRVVEDDEKPLAALERRIADRDAASLSERRVAGILEKAFDEIKASEARTAELIGRLAQTMPETPAKRMPASVHEILASAESRAAARSNVVELPGARAAAPAAAVTGIVGQLQESVARHEIDKALRLLERQLAMVEPQDAHDQIMLKGMASELASIRAVVTAEGAQVPLASIEGPIASLTARIGAMISAPKAPKATPGTDVKALDRKLDEVAAATTAMVVGIQDELVRLGQHGLNRDDAQVGASFDRLENRITQLEQATRMPLDDISRRLDALRAEPRDRGDDEVRRSIAGLERRMEQLSARISQPLQMVHNTMTQLARQRTSAQADGQRLDQIFAELAMLKRGFAEQASGAGLGFSAVERQLSAIARRVDAISERLQEDDAQDSRREAGKPSIEDEIEEIKELLREAKSPCDDTRVLDAIGHLERKIAALENSPRALMDRFDSLQARLEERPAAAGGLPANVEVLLRNLAARLETPTAQAALDDAAVDRLQQEIRALGRKIETSAPPAFAPATAAPAQDLTAVERSIGDLFRQIDGLKTEVGERAARAAADAVRESRSFLPPAADPAPFAETSLIEASIGQLRRSQAEAEQRTTQTLEALHETLQRVVDRLGAMEQEARRAPVAAPQPVFAAPSFAAPIPQFGPAQQASPSASDEPFGPTVPPPAFEPPAPAFEQSSPPRARAPDIQDDGLNLLPPDILEPRTQPENAPQPSPETEMPRAPSRAVAEPNVRPANSFAETLASIRSGRDTGAPKAEPAPEAKNAMASAFAAARAAMANLKRAKAEEPQGVAAPAAAAARPDVPAAAPQLHQGDFDLPLEPGSGRPAPAAARQQPAPQPAAASTDPKADFIAAARRAAQAAAQQSAAVLAEADPKKSGRIGKAGRAPADIAAVAGEASRKGGLRAKHAILLGVAALIVAAGAGYQYLAFNQRAAAPAVVEPQRSSSILPQRPAPTAAPAQTTAATQQTAQPESRPRAEAPRQILPPPIANEAARPADQPQTAARDTQPQAAPRDESLTVGSIAAPERVPPVTRAAPAADDPLLRFEGLRDAPRLRDAARRGDVSAFVELGQRYFDGRGAPRDHRTAALWFERAAEHGSAPAQYRLGTMYREGRGVERNPKTALRHFQTSAEAGNARGMHNTAVLLAEGVNGAPDYAAAAEWFRKAAEFGIKDSQYNLAILHARGLGVAQDLMASYAWFAAAAANGDEDAGKKRDEVGSRLSPERLQQARAAAAQWKAKTPDAAANEVSMPQGGWDAEARPAATGNQPRPGAGNAPQRRI